MEVEMGMRRRRHWEEAKSGHQLSGLGRSRSCYGVKSQKMVGRMRSGGALTLPREQRKQRKQDYEVRGDGETGETR